MAKLTIVVGGVYRSVSGEIFDIIENNEAHRWGNCMIGISRVDGRKRAFGKDGTYNPDDKADPDNLSEALPEFSLPLDVVVEGTYEARGGDQITLVRELSDAPGSPDKKWFDQGYRFRAHNGDTYLPDGRYVPDELTSLDLIKPILKEYLVLYGYGNKSFLTEAVNPIQAKKQFDESEYLGDVNHIYELLEVTPNETEED